MRLELESIRRSLLELDVLDRETREALATLEAAIAEIERHPAAGRVREVVSETAVVLSKDSPEGNEGLAEKWEDLRDHLVNWEEEHPGIVLAIGRVSNSLATFGL